MPFESRRSALSLFAGNGKEPRPTFAFPGIWRRYQGPVRKDGPKVDLEVYSFLTTTPNKLVATINHERMPVLLTHEHEFEAWLRGSSSEAFALAREYPPDRMRIVQEGFRREDQLDAAAMTSPILGRKSYGPLVTPIVTPSAVEPTTVVRGGGRQLVPLSLTRRHQAPRCGARHVYTGNTCSLSHS